MILTTGFVKVLMFYENLYFKYWAFRRKACICSVVGQVAVPASRFCGFTFCEGFKFDESYPGYKVIESNER